MPRRSREVALSSRTAAVVLFVLAQLAAPSLAFAVDFYVNSTLDQIDDDVLDGLCHTTAGTCTLRAAVMQANRISGAGTTIYLPPGTYTLTRPATGGNGDDSGDLNLTPPAAGNPVINLIGAGAASTIIDANQLDRVIRVEGGRTANLAFVTMRNGFTGGRGGGLNSAGRTTVHRCTISGNQALVHGGGIGVNGLLTVTASTIQGNTAAEAGGGIDVQGTLIVTASTIQGNSAGSGGGIYVWGVFGGDLTLESSTVSGNFAGSGGGIGGWPMFLINSTISSNQAAGSGGGVRSDGSVNVYNSTIAFNDADADGISGGVGGGTFGNINLRNTLVVGNTRLGGTIENDCWGAVSSYGRNLFWNVTECNIMVVSGSWGLLNSLATIGPLAKNGGSTVTRALLPGSSAIDDGDPVFGCAGPDGLPLPTDQRGVDRVHGIGCDVGAYEFGVLFLDGFESGEP